MAQLIAYIGLAAPPTALEKQNVSRNPGNVSVLQLSPAEMEIVRNKLFPDDFVLYDKAMQYPEVFKKVF